MIKLRIFMIIIFLFILSPSIVLGNNDTMDATHATTFDSAINLKSYDSFLQVEDEDLSTPGWIQFDLQARQGITAAITASINQGNLDMVLFDQYGNSIDSFNNVTNSTTGTITYTPTVSGTYYLRIDGDYGAAGTYDLAVFNAWFNPGITDVSRSFFSSRSTAKYIASGGFDLSSYNEDWYRFEAQGGEAFAVDLTAHINQGNLDMGLFDQYGNNLASRNDVTDGNTKTVSYTPTVSGAYYLRVDGDYGAYGSYSLSPSGDLASNTDTDGDGLYDAAEYHHQTNLNEPDSDGDGVSDPEELAQGSDPNHNYPTLDSTLATSQANALPLEPRDQFHAVQDADLSTFGWFRFDLVAGQGITAAVTAHINRGNLDMALFDEYGNNLIYRNDIPDGNTKTISYTPTVSGTYYLRVDGDSGAYGAYDLAVFNAWFNPDVTDCNRFFYSSLNTSQLMLSEEYGLSRYDSEYFRFFPVSGKSVQIDITPHINIGNLDMWLMNANGNTIQSISNVTNGNTRTFNYTASSSEVHYLRIRKDSGAYGAFSLNITGLEDSDDDGMLDEWEMLYFCHLDRDGTLYWDDDQLTDKQEHDLGTHPKQEDTDDDGMPDGWEVFESLDPLTNDALADKDSDGFCNLREYRSDTNPNDATDFPAGTLIFVQSGFAGEELGTILNPFNTIGEGIAYSGPGDTIRVLDGEYVENLVINKNIDLLGNGKDKVIINGTNHSEPTIKIVNLEKLHLSGFHIKHGYESSIECDNATLEVLDTIISESYGGYGINILSNSNIIIKNSIIRHNMLSGILISDNTSTAAITNCNIVFNQIGLTCNSGQNIFIFNSIIYKNTDYGIACYTEPGPLLAYNNIASNAAGNYLGCTQGLGSISKNPYFTNVDEYDFHLALVSPCIDSGDPIKFLTSDYSGGDKIFLDSTMIIFPGSFIWITNGNHTEKLAVNSIDGKTITLNQPLELEYLVADEAYCFTETSDFHKEPTLNGQRINIGAYGGTKEATISDTCEGDFDNDHDVDGLDLSVFAADFGRTDCNTQNSCKGDFDRDNDVDGTDLAVFTADFGRTDCP